MKFVKGAIIGSMITASALMMYNSKEMDHTKKKMIKKGRQFARKMGML